MYLLIILGMIIGFILTPILPILWHRVLVAAFTGILGFFVLQYFINESQKSNWVLQNDRIQEPSKQLIIDIRDGYQQDDPKTEELTNYMIENWHRVGMAPWLKSVDEVRSEFQQN